MKIGSTLKPPIDKKIVEQWQSLIDTAARIVDVPAGLIMQLEENSIEVFIKSDTGGNPYHAGEKSELMYGLYCETVIGTQEKLLVPDATKNQLWQNDNPDIKINMISYLGYPINWPDGEVFGTVCLLDSKENHYNKDYESFLYQVKLHLEADLSLQILNNELEDKNSQLKQLNETKSKFLSLISHDVRGSVAAIDGLIKLVISEFNHYERDDLKSVLVSLSESAGSSREMLDNLLSWSKREIIQINPDFKLINIVDVVESTIQVFSQSILLKELVITKMYYSSDACIKTDENMIKVILRNIVSNAIKFNSKNGEIIIKISQNNDKHEISVTDTGVGMSSEAVEALFKNYEHTSTGTLGETGSGIGLILSKEFADKLNAKITVTSKIAQGTTFTVTI